jgi:hypothetical protein
VERQVAIVRDHVLTGRSFGSIAELDGAFNQWVPIRRAQRHRTHGELIGARAATDRAALGPLPELPYLVCERHLRRVGRDCLISFEGSHYSTPARAHDGIPARAGQRVEVRVSAATVTIHHLPVDGDPIVLAAHHRAARRGELVVDPTHWDGLPDGHTRATTLDPPPEPNPTDGASVELDPLAALLAHRPAAATAVTRRPLAAYDTAAPGLHFHDLRHTGNHFAAQTGASTADLMARMGHDDMRAALIYQRATSEADRRIADRMSALVKRPDPAVGDSGEDDGGAAPVPKPGPG